MSTNASGHVPGPAPAPAPALALAAAAAPTLVIPDAIKSKHHDLVSALGPVQEEAAAPAAKRRKRSPNSALRVPPLERLTTAAKFFTRAVSPFLDIGDAMLYGPEHHWSPPVVSCPSNLITIHSSELEQQQIHIKAFNKIFSTVPDLLDVVKHVYLEIPTKSKQWKLLVKAMQTAARSARTADTNGLKHQLSYTLLNPTKDVLDPPVLKQESKSDRRVTHPMLRHLILPWDHRSSLPPPPVCAPPLTANPEPIITATFNTVNATGTPAQNEFLKSLGAGTVELKAADFPSFFWEDGSYDPNDLGKGLLRGHLLLRVLRHIWTAHGSALCGLNNGELPAICNARAHGVFVVDPEMIARTMLSTSEWKVRNGPYDYKELFDSIVKLFADPDDPWTKDTLDWYQQNVFGGATIDNSHAIEPTSDAASNILAQCAAHRAASVIISHHRNSVITSHHRNSIYLFSTVCIPHIIATSIASSVAMTITNSLEINALSHHRKLCSY
ncbi:hypothetical protein B0H17DRAFT_1209305 [Mycena rosella]|uniref:Uncharacterized protein n=1 Tax=Mycena rosella TaxID=1033263 RepID=A0AAD7G679_MYCRO|nr:hypothetical protein B0H17DRAFT_1209305 [Mycena rosella]